MATGAPTPISLKLGPLSAASATIIAPASASPSEENVLPKAAAARTRAACTSRSTQSSRRARAAGLAGCTAIGPIGRWTSCGIAIVSMPSVGGRPAACLVRYMPGILGVCMVCAWYLHGICMVYAWCMHGMLTMAILTMGGLQRDPERCPGARCGRRHVGVRRLRLRPWPCDHGA